LEILERCHRTVPYNSGLYILLSFRVAGFAHSNLPTYLHLSMTTTLSLVFFGKNRNVERNKVGRGADSAKLPRSRKNQA